jgi:EpsI family protein
MADLARFAPAVLLASGCALIFGVREQLKMESRTPMSAVRVEAPGYQVSEIEVPEEERRVAGMSDYVMREFRRDSLDAGFSIYVGYYDYQQQGKTIHSPKNCLPGAGWEAVEAGVRPMKSVDGSAFMTNRYVLANKGAQALVYYWYQGRGRIEASEYKVKWHLVRDAALHGRTEEALVRIVVPIDTRGLRDQSELAARRASADSLATSIAARLEPEVRRALPVAPGAS